MPTMKIELRRGSQPPLRRALVKFAAESLADYFVCLARLLESAGAMPLNETCEAQVFACHRTISNVGHGHEDARVALHRVLDDVAQAQRGQAAGSERVRGLRTENAFLFGGGVDARVRFGSLFPELAEKASDGDFTEALSVYLLPRPSRDAAVANLWKAMTGVTLDPESVKTARKKKRDFRGRKGGAKNAPP